MTRARRRKKFMGLRPDRLAHQIHNFFYFFRTVSMVAPSQYKCHDVVVGCVLADICMCISPSLIHFTFLIASSMRRPVSPKHLLRLLGA